MRFFELLEYLEVDSELSCSKSGRLICLSTTIYKTFTLFKSHKHTSAQPILCSVSLGVSREDTNRWAKAKTRSRAFGLCSTTASVDAAIDARISATFVGYDVVEAIMT